MLSRNSALFWRFTREMLAMESGVEGAGHVDYVLRELEPKGPTELCEIFVSAGPAGISGLAEVLRGR